MPRYLTAAMLAAALASPCHANDLEPLAFLAGKCWTGAFPDGNARDTHCYSWIYGGKFLRDVHVVEGMGDPYCGETIYHNDPEDGSIRFTYYNSLGGISRGTLNETGQDLQSPAERYEGPDGTTVLIRSRLVPRDDGKSYVAVSERQRDGRWEQARRVVFHHASGLNPESALAGACSD